FFLGWQNLGNIYLDMGDYEKAVKAFQKALKIEKRSAECYMDMGIALKELGKYDEALKAYEKAEQINPDLKALSLYNKACLYASKGDKEKSLKLLKESFSIDPSLKDYAKTDPDLKGLL
ncbi:tetratricopeptide repeat protein, partial [Persephonella sp.]